MIRVLVVDDHQVVREGFCSLLEKQEDMEVVGQAGNGREAIELTRKLMPSIILMDISMPDMNGIDAASRIHAEFPSAKVIILSIHTNQHYVERALQVGIQGYLLKNCPFEELLTAIRTVAANKVYLSPDIADVVIEGYLHPRQDHNLSAISLDLLTAREREILQLIAEGLTTKEIAQRLNLGDRTIETHRQKLMNKLNISNVAQLIKFAIREGITDVDV